MGSKIKRNYENWSNNLKDFNWGKSKPKPPIHCSEDECMHIDNEHLVDSDGIENCPEDIYYGFGTSQKKVPVNITAKFGLSRIFNIIWLVPEALPGLHNSYLYFGKPHAFFPVHVEDGLLLSLNYLHVGHPKIW